MSTINPACSGITLCCVDCVNQPLSLRALQLSRAALPFARVVLLTDGEYSSEGVEVVRIPSLTSREAYSRFIVKELGRYIETDYVLLVQWDGYVVNPAAWEAEFLEYDYIGAPWGWHKDAHRVGNGGFSLRSKRLLAALADPEIADLEPEDEAICRRYRPLLESRYGIRFAPEEVAIRFSFEATYPQGRPFGFHGLFNMWMFIAPQEFGHFLAALTPAILRSRQLLQLGRNYRDLGRREEAVAILQRRLEVMPDDADAREVLRTLAPPRPAAAVPRRNDPCPCGSGRRYKECCGQMGASAPPPASPVAPVAPPQPNAAEVLREALRNHQAGQLYRAEALYQQVLRLEPDNAHALHYSGVLRMQQGRPGEAESLIRASLAAAPDIPDFHNNLGLCLRAQGTLEAALACYRQALTVKPDYPEAWNNLGLDLQQLGRIDEALAAYEQAVRLRPDFAEAHWNLGLVLLLRGDYPRGWAEYEWRLRCPGFAAGKRIPAGLPVWRGEPLAGKTVLLGREQGFGDNFQFIRFVPQLAALGARVIVEAMPEDAELLGRAEGVGGVVLKDEPTPVADYYCPLLSLPHRLGVTLETIPRRTPYLSVPPEHQARWQGRIGEGGLRVGLVWAGSPTHANDRNRSSQLADLVPLLNLPGIHWFSLQKGPAAEQLEPLGHPNLTALGPQLRSFTDTAAVLEQLDLLVCVDTSVAHLAGALGRPCWVMLPYAPDFRWLLDRDDSPWYPGMRLFRQPVPGNWGDVLERMKSALAARLTGLAMA